jgi:hypothetical protein
MAVKVCRTETDFSCFVRKLQIKEPRGAINVRFAPLRKGLTKKPLDFMREGTIVLEKTADRDCEPDAVDCAVKTSV